MEKEEDTGTETSECSHRFEIPAQTVRCRVTRYDQTKVGYTSGRPRAIVIR